MSIVSLHFFASCRDLRDGGSDLLRLLDSDRLAGGDRLAVRCWELDALGASLGSDPGNHGVVLRHRVVPAAVGDRDAIQGDDLRAEVSSEARYGELSWLGMGAPSLVPAPGRVCVAGALSELTTSR